MQYFLSRSRVVHLFYTRISATSIKMPYSNCFCASLLGPTFPLLFIQHHEEGPLWLRLYLLIPTILFVGHMAIGPAQAQEAVIAILLLMTSSSASLFTSILIYRIFLHQIKSSLRPSLAKTTKFWHVPKVAQSSETFPQFDSLYHQ